MIIGDAPDRIAQWIRLRFGKSFEPPFTALAYCNRQGVIRGAAILNCFHDGDIELSCFGHHGMSKELVRAIAHTAFNINQCERISLTIRGNPQVLKLAKKYGFVIEGIKRRPSGAPDVLLGMLRADCRFLGD